MMDPGRDRDLLVLTQNVWGGAALWEPRCAMLAQRIAELRPAILGLQEVHEPGIPGQVGQAEELARLAGGYRAWFAQGRIAAGGESEGVALLCREDIEVLDHSVEALTLDRDDPIERDSQRVVLRAAIRRAGTVIDVLVTHLSLSRRARARTARELVEFAARERKKSGSAGAVLMGDFNALPSEEAVRYLEATAGEGSWIDVWKRAHPGVTGGTWPAGVPFRRIDYVFVQPEERWSIARCERTPFSGSDHLGVAAWLRLR